METSFLDEKIAEQSKKINMYIPACEVKKVAEHQYSGQVF
jgi:hypothetical protein